ncbi:Epithelial Splicing Regulatory Protein 1 [Manis pentadactyla]|nr:Epithelial Splicing Regulatory Protein 1 [Manis pentadactyla]
MEVIRTQKQQGKNEGEHLIEFLAEVRRSSTLLESRHSHNISCPIFGKKVAVEMKMECFEFEERLKRLCLNLYMVRSLSTEKSSGFGRDILA